MIAFINIRKQSKDVIRSRIRLDPKCPTISYALVVDNTLPYQVNYAPDAAELPLFRMFFRLNFPGLDVLALNFLYPLLAKYSTKLLCRKVRILDIKPQSKRYFNLSRIKVDACRWRCRL